MACLALTLLAWLQARERLMMAHGRIDDLEIAIDMHVAEKEEFKEQFNDTSDRLAAVQVRIPTAWRALCGIVSSDRLPSSPARLLDGYAGCPWGLYGAAG